MSLLISSTYSYLGILGKYIPSLVATFTPVDEVIDENELGHAVFSKENLNDNDSPDIMVNIIKKKDVKVMDKYENEVVWRMFPMLETKIFVGGTPDWPKSDSWDVVRTKRCTELFPTNHRLQSDTEKWCLLLVDKF